MVLAGPRRLAGADLAGAASPLVHKRGLVSAHHARAVRVDGTAVTNSAIGDGATRMTWARLQPYLDAIAGPVSRLERNRGATIPRAR